MTARETTPSDAIPENESQRSCREWWQAREPHVNRAWGRDKKTGRFLSEFAQSAHSAWIAAREIEQSRGAHMRVDFENWLREEYPAIPILTASAVDDRYLSPGASFMWSAWQAAYGEACRRMGKGDE